MTPQELTEALEAIMDDEIIAGMEAGWSAMLKEAISDILIILKDLNLTASGGIKTTVANLKIINKAKNKLQSVIYGPDYSGAVGNISRGFTRASETMNAYMTVLTASFEPTARMQAVLSLNIQAAADTLGATGLGTTFAAKVNQFLTQAVTSGMNFRDFIAGVQNELRIEALLNVSKFNVKQIVTDSYGIMSGHYMQLAGERVNTKWYVYRGGKIKTTRSWCEQRAGHFYHIDEIRSWAADDWAGKMEGTTADTILQTRGGWNCRHRFIPVSADMVPEADKQRFQEINV